MYWFVWVQAWFNIVELMPNTIDDSNLEYIVILNNSDLSESLEWYYLQDASWKKYTFLWDEVLESQEKKKYLRSQTKLILNNSNEILSLYSWEDILEDTVEYKKTTKWIALMFWDAQGEESHEEIIEKWENEVENINEEKIDEQNLEILFSLQRPSYITQSWSTDIYLCDNLKDECKVNFNLEESFSEGYSKGDYRCMIDFWIITNEEEKCNPNTVIFPEWISNVIFQIFHKDTNLLVSQKEIKIIFDRSLGNTQVLSQNSSSSKRAKLALRKPNIIVQSWLDGRGTNFYCQRIDCKMNLNYEKIHNDERCFWDFWPGLASSESTRTRCNPWYVDIPEGSFELSLRIYEDNFESNSKIQKFYIHNISHETQWEDTQIMQDKAIGQQWEEISVEVMEKIQASINLQWKMSQEKTLSWNTLRCSWVEKCYVNFTSEINHKSGELWYKWSNNGVVFSEKENPLWEWFGSWEHEIIFEIMQDNTSIIEEKFYISVEWSMLESSDVWYSIQENDIWEPILFSGDSQDYQWWNTSKKIDINFTQNFLVLKYDWLRISGKSPLWSKVELYLWEEKIWEAVSSEKWKYRIVSKDFSEWNYTFDTKIILWDWKELFLRESWNKEIISDDRAHWFITKKTSSRKNKISQKNKKTQFIIKSEKEKIVKNENSAHLSLFYRVVFSMVLVFLSVLWVFHIFSIMLKKMWKTRTFSHMTTAFSVRQKVCLIVH